MKSIFFLFFFFSTIVGYTKPPIDAYYWHSSTFDKHFQKGMNAVFDYDMVNAEKQFDSLIIIDGDRPEGYYYKSYCYFWKYFMGEKKNDYDKFMEYNDVALEKAKLYLEKNESISIREALGYYFLGEAYTYRAVLLAKSGSFISSAWNANKAKGNYEKALEKDPNFYDAQKGVGIFRFIVSLIPPSMNWIAEALNYKPDRQGGLELMRVAYQNGYYSKKELEFYLTVIDFYFYKKRIETEQKFIQLVNASPTSSMYLYSIAYLYYSSSQFTMAQSYLKRLVDNFNRDPDDGFGVYGLYLYGDIFFYQNNFEDALKYFSMQRSKNVVDFFKSRLPYRIGQCYEILGKRKEAIENYKEARVMINVVSDELYAFRKAKEYTQTPMNELEKKSIMIYNNICSGNFAKGREMIAELNKQNLSKDEKSMVYYYLGRINDFEGNNIEAIKNYEESANNFPVRERQYPPLSRLYLGRLYYRLENFMKAREEFEKAVRYSNYDYEITVRREVSLLLDKMRLENK